MRATKKDLGLSRWICIGTLAAMLLWALFAFQLPDAWTADPSCTIFTVTRGDSVLFGNNEDNDDERSGTVWFRRSRDQGNGLVLFGYRMIGILDIPVAGMNDKGLIAAPNTVGFTRVSIDPEKETVPGSFFIKMLEECSTVGDVERWVTSKNLLFLETQQMHVADRSGDAIILGLDERGETGITRKSGSYLISTNFNLAQRSPEEDTCWRYQTATSMLEGLDEPTVEDLRDILDATTLPYIMYSLVVDLPAGLIHLFSDGDFERTVTLDVSQELSKWNHSYDMETLVTRGARWIDRPVEPGLIVLSLIVLTGLAMYYAARARVIHSRRRTRILMVGLVALIGLLRNGLTIPIRFIVVRNLVTLTLHLSLSVVLVYMVGLMFKPYLAFGISSLGVILGEILHSWISGSGANFMLHLLIAVSSYGVGAAVVSMFRKRNEILAMVAGAVWMFIGFALPAYYHFTRVVDWDEYVLFFALAFFATNLLLIPVTFVLNKSTRSVVRLRPGFANPPK